MSRHPCLVQRRASIEREEGRKFLSYQDAPPIQLQKELAHLLALDSIWHREIGYVNLVKRHSVANVVRILTGKVVRLYPLTLSRNADIRLIHVAESRICATHAT
ncbi:hypothetical protein BRAO375_740020 [Bradyrhizobium sp. ORS 375]|nr:hypothetical protein BRAO375_740020 [Bradyrhizobium sp. ORS 375]